MIHGRFFIALASCIALAPFAAVAAESADRDFVVDSRVMLDGYRAAVEARLGGVLTATRTPAATGEVRSGEWAQGLR